VPIVNQWLNLYRMGYAWAGVGKKESKHCEGGTARNANLLRFYSVAGSPAEALKTRFDSFIGECYAQPWRGTGLWSGLRYNISVESKQAQISAGGAL